MNRGSALDGTLELECSSAWDTVPVLLDCGLALDDVPEVECSPALEAMPVLTDCGFVLVHILVLVDGSCILHLSTVEVVPVLDSSLGVVVLVHGSTLVVEEISVPDGSPVVVDILVLDNDLVEVDDDLEVDEDLVQVDDDLVQVDSNLDNGPSCDSPLV